MVAILDIISNLRIFHRPQILLNLPQIWDDFCIRMQDQISAMHGCFETLAFRLKTIPRCETNFLSFDHWGGAAKIQHFFYPHKWRLIDLPYTGGYIWQLLGSISASPIMSPFCQQMSLVILYAPTMICFPYFLLMCCSLSWMFHSVC